MTVEEYKAECLRYLGSQDWLEESGARECFLMSREDYLSGGWSEDDLDTLATLSVLLSLQEIVAGSDQEEERMLDIWHDLPVRDELRLEVLRKDVVDWGLRVMEGVKESELDEAARPDYRKNLERMRAQALAASFGDFSMDEDD
jgi:hypothetical protein